MSDHRGADTSVSLPDAVGTISTPVSLPAKSYTSVGLYDFVTVHGLVVANFRMRMSEKMPLCDHGEDCTLYIIAPAPSRHQTHNSIIIEEADIPRSGCDPKGLGCWAFCACSRPAREACSKMQWIADDEALATCETAAKEVSKDVNRDVNRRSKEHVEREWEQQCVHLMAELQCLCLVAPAISEVGSRFRTSGAKAAPVKCIGVPTPPPQSLLVQLSQLGVPLSVASTAMDTVDHAGMVEALDWMKSKGGKGCCGDVERKCASPYCKFCLIISTVISVASLGSIPAFVDPY